MESTDAQSCTACYANNEKKRSFFVKKNNDRKLKNKFSDIELSLWN